MDFTGNDDLALFEFDKIREHIASHCRVSSSLALAAQITPVKDINALEVLLKQGDEFVQTLKSGGYFPDTFFEDFLSEAELLSKEGSMLTESQFARIGSASKTVNSILKFFAERKYAFPYLSLLAKEVYLDEEIIRLIDLIIDTDEQVKSNASRELQEIRSRLASSRRESDRRFRTFIAEAKKKGWLRDNEENFYNNRRVLAVPSEYKREIRGLIHGKSDSGKTTFIEPEALVELNNEISELESDERAEIIRLLRELTSAIRPHSKLITAYHYFLTELDLLRAKSYFAIETGSSLPQISKQPVIQLFNARHPLLFLQNKKKGIETVPLDIDLSTENRILIISGPNAGGKSITLKTVGLLQIMLQSGLLVPADERSRMSMFQKVLVDLGDSQSIENALSTYSSRLIRMNQFLRNSNGKTLVLIDEFGTGTDPELGGAIAEAVLEELNARKVFGIFTTHYTNLKLLADKLVGVQNASMLFDPQTLKPKYKMIPGQPGSSYTFEVAERIGLPQHVLNRAKNKVKGGKLNLNNMLSSLNENKNKLEEEIKSLRKKEEKTVESSERFQELTKKLEEKLKKDALKHEETKVLSDLGRRMKLLADEWEKTKDKKIVIKKFVNSMTAEKKKKAADNTPEKVTKRKAELIERLKKEIQVGSKVRMLKGKQTGIVEEIKKNTVYVNFGNIRAKVAIENLELAE